MLTWLAGLHRVRLFRLLGVAEVEVARRAVHEGVDPQALAVGGDADVHRQRHLRRIADRRDVLGLPFAGFASCLISQSLEVSAVAVTAQLSPSFSDQRISSGAPGTLDDLQRLHRLHVPGHHGVAEALHRLGP
jgi:hypothetical protein